MKMRGVLRMSMAVVTFGAVGCGGSPSTPGDNACGTGKIAGNGNSDHATSYALGSQVEGCVGTATETHFYQVTAPDDRTGGYVQASVSGTGIETMRVIAHAQKGTAELARFAPEASATAVSFFLAVAPGQDYQIEIANEGALREPYTFMLSATYTQVPDSFEPNDLFEAATPVTVNTTLQAYLFVGRRDAEDSPVGYDDYYRFAAGSGAVKITVDEVAPDLAPRITLYSADGGETARVASGIKGGALVMQSPVLAAPGDLVVRVSPWSGSPQSLGPGGPGSVLPAHFTRPYQLSITQP